MPLTGSSDGKKVLCARCAIEKYADYVEKKTKAGAQRISKGTNKWNISSFWSIRYLYCCHIDGGCV
jgi:hypothetical protein